MVGSTQNPPRGARNVPTQIRDFAFALQGADIGLFFYSGHGLQVAGQN
jgi:uncharacterized caspase-like protein